MAGHRYRILRLCLNLDRPADRRLAEAVDAARPGAMRISDLLREALGVYLAMDQCGAPASAPAPAVRATGTAPAAVSAHVPAEEDGIDVFDMAIHRSAAAGRADNDTDT